MSLALVDHTQLGQTVRERLGLEESRRMRRRRRDRQSAPVGGGDRSRVCGDRLSTVADHPGKRSRTRYERREWVTRARGARKDLGTPLGQFPAIRSDFFLVDARSGEDRGVDVSPGAHKMGQRDRLVGLGGLEVGRVFDRVVLVGQRATMHVFRHPVGANRRTGTLRSILVWLAVRVTGNRLLTRAAGKAGGKDFLYGWGGKKRSYF